MAYIQPNSTVQFFGDLGLDSSYENTLYFATTSAKDTYFDSITKIAQASPLSYSRAERGYIRVELPMSTLISAGYMRFKNTSFENKWFYAFIKNVEYINNNVTQVNFELDVMMTWMGTFQLGECFIERQHTLTDGIGNNIVDEGLDTGEYIIEGSSTTAFFGQYVIVTIEAEDAEGEAGGILQGGVYSGCYLHIHTTAASATAHIQALVTAQKSDTIVAIYMLPVHYVGDQILGTDAPIEDNFVVEKPYSTIAGYTPRNKKLFCYPYKCLAVYNSEGEANEYYYEYFNTLPDTTSSGDASFKIYGICQAQSEIICVPQNYKGIQENLSERITMKKFPQCSWNIDEFKAYLAQKESSLMVSSYAAGASGIASIAAIGTGNTFTGISSLLNFGSQYKETLRSASELIGAQVARKNGYTVMPNVAKGTQDTNVLVGSKKKNFYFLRKSITKNYAMVIDSYFDMFGYAIKHHAIPNMNARPNWTYVKTIGCIVHGNLPADDGAEIEKIFDNGVRFWKNHSNIGNYSLNNAPV